MPSYGCRPPPSTTATYTLPRVSTRPYSQAAPWVQEDKNWLDAEVIINPNINWGPSGRHQDMKQYRILGMPTDGTLAEYLVVPVDRLSSRPAHLRPEQAAALPLGGMTAYRALFSRGALKDGQHVLISGVGGGVAQFALQFAVAAGARAWVTSGKPENIIRALELGAEGGASYKEPAWDQKLREQADGFHLAIDSAGGDQINTLLNLLNPGGRYVFYGATNGVPTRLDLHKIFWKQLNILGSTMASDDEFQSMLHFVQQHRIQPVVDQVFPFAEARAAFQYLDTGHTMGKVVIRF
jgi:zinc-binding alcohol dehydrogenase/oxidoreductase